MEAKPVQFTVSKELLEKLGLQGRITVHAGGSIGIPVPLDLLHSLDSGLLAQHGLAVMLVPAEMEAQR